MMKTLGFVSWCSSILLISAFITDVASHRLRILDQGRYARLVADNALRSPHAKLFTTANNTGDFEAYNLSSTKIKGGCYNLKRFPGKIKSVDSYGSCIRLFRGFYCQIWSQSVYSGSSNIPDAKLDGVRSIGPCVSNEFKHSAMIKTTPPQLVKLPSALESFANVPDLISDSFAQSHFTHLKKSSNPVQEYLLGPGNRLEAIRGWIYPRHLKSPASTEDLRVAGFEQSFYSKLELEEGEEPGFAFPLELGGPADQIYNVFPQNRKQARIFKGKIVPLVKQMLADHPNQSVRWTVKFVYKNHITRRPSGMWYYGDRYNQEIFYGYVPNPE